MASWQDITGRKLAAKIKNQREKASFFHGKRHSFPEFSPRFYSIPFLPALSVWGPTSISELPLTPGSAPAPSQYMTFQSLPPT